MFPPQTSFIPAQVALARFLETEGLRAVFSNYPYWYLGSTPFRWLTGPVVPGLTAILRSLLPATDFFVVFYMLLVIFWFLGGAGVYGLVREMKGSRLSAFFSALFFVFGPLVPFLFRFSDGISLMAFAFLPYVLLVFYRFLKKKGPAKPPTLIILISFLLLIDISILSTMILAFVAMFLAVRGWKGAEEKIKSSVALLFFSLLAISCWYGFGYWWQMLTAPSFGGKSLLSVVNLIGQLLPISLAITLAALSGRFVRGRESLRPALYILRFSFFWLFIFGFLTLIRFLSDPDFWLDWSSYGTELQFGLAVGLGAILGRPFGLVQGKLGKLGRLGLLGAWLLLFVFVFQRGVVNTLQRDSTQSAEYRVGEWLWRNVNVNQGDTVFLSGSTVFWLNAFFDVPQVRGGNDGPSKYPDWREIAWEVREGKSGSEAVRRLKDIGVDYLVVHSLASDEYWHDFKDPEKFEGVEGLRKVYEEKGDIIYEIEY